MSFVARTLTRAARRRLGSAILVAAAGPGLAACSTGREISMIRSPDTASRIDVAMAAEASGEVGIAVSMYGAAADAAPDDMDVQSRYAAMLTRVGQPQQADQVLARALERRPGDPTLLVALAQLRLRTGATPEAITLFDRVLARRPTDVGALNGRGVALDLLGRHGEAQQSYRAAQAVSPADIPTANNLALSLMLDGQAAEAMSILSALSHRAHVPSRVISNLGIAQAVAGDRAAAQATLAGRIDNEDLDIIAAGFGVRRAQPMAEAPDAAGASGSRAAAAGPAPVLTAAASPIKPGPAHSSR